MRKVPVYPSPLDVWKDPVGTIELTDEAALRLANAAMTGQVMCLEIMVRRPQEDGDDPLLSAVSFSRSARETRPVENPHPHRTRSHDNRRNMESLEGVYGDVDAFISGDFDSKDEEHPCPTCDGEGMVDFEQCPDCGGDGTHLAYQ